MSRNIDEDWEKKKEYLIRCLFQDMPLLSPVQEEESFSNGRSDRHTKFTPKRRISTHSPLPPLIIEKEPNRHDEPEEYYKQLDKRIQRAYRKLFIEEQSDVYSDDMRSDCEIVDDLDVDESIDMIEAVERKSSQLKRRISQNNSNSTECSESKKTKKNCSNTRDLDVDESIDMVEAVERKSGQKKRRISQNNSNSTKCSEPKKSKENCSNTAEGSISKSQSIDDEKSTSTEILPKSTSDETDERGSLTSPIDITVNMDDLEKSDTVSSRNKADTADENVTVNSESISDSLQENIQVTFQAEVHREAGGLTAEGEVNEVVAEDNDDEGANLEDAAILESSRDDLQEYRQVTFQAEVHREADGVIAEDEDNEVVAEDNGDEGANLEDVILESSIVSENRYLLERSENETEDEIEVMRRPNVRLSASSLHNAQRDSFIEDIDMEEPPALIEAQIESSESDKADSESKDLETNLDLQDVSTPLANETIEREHSTSSSSDETIYETDASTQTFDVFGMNGRILNSIFVGVPTVFRLCSCANHRCNC